MLDADPWTRAEDPFEFVGGGAVDGQPPVIEVGHLNEGVGAFDDVGEEFALGERLGHAALERLVQLAQPRLALAHRALGEHLLGRLRARAEHSRDFAAFVADRRVGEGEPGLLVVAFAVHEERQIFAVGRVPGHRRVDQRTDVGPDLRPDVVEAPAKRARMLGAENLGVGVVVEEAERVPPRNEHRKLRLEQEADDGAQ